MHSKYQKHFWDTIATIGKQGYIEVNGVQYRHVALNAKAGSGKTRETSPRGSRRMVHG